MQDIAVRDPRVAATGARDHLDARRERLATSTHDLTQLLGRRPELCGIHAPADLLADMVTWSA